MCEFHESTCNGFGDIWCTDNPIYFSSIDQWSVEYLENAFDFKYLIPLFGAIELLITVFLTFPTFRRRLHVRGNGSCRDLSIFLGQWPILP